MNFYRESTVYVQADIEGFLDKKESGVLRTKIVKGLWCWVQGSIFYQQKAQSNNGTPGGIDVLDMADVHYVRNLSTDTTGTQFEIFIKKGQVYICPNRENCTAWIAALQKAMAIKGSGHSQGINPSSNVYTSSSEDGGDIYSEIPNTGGGGGSQGQTPLSSTHNGHTTHQYNDMDENVYSTPLDSVENENVYSDVVEAGGISQNDKPGVCVSVSAKTPPQNAGKPDLPPPRADVNNNGSLCQNDQPQQTDSCYADGVSLGQAKQTSYIKNDTRSGQSSVKKSVKPKRRAPPAPHVKDVGVTSPSGGAAESHPAPQPDTDAVGNLKQTEDDIGNREDELMHIFDSMNIESEVPDLEFVITNDDAKPVTDLKTCLRENNVHCRVSTNRLSRNQDVIASCKSFLTSLDNAM